MFKVYIYSRQDITRIIICVLLILTSLFYKEAYSEGLGSVIKSFCLEEFQTETKSVSSKISTSIGEFTCDCFIDKINAGSSISNARDMCKKKATKKFNL